MGERKKILIFIGSPRDGGNTSILCGKLRDNLAEGGYQVEMIRLYAEKIEPCRDCRACKKGSMECVIEDDMRGLYEKMEESDVIVIGTPIYWLGPTAKTKLLLDRFRPYYASRRLAGKRAALVLPAGSGEKECDLAIKMFEESFRLLGVDFSGAVTAKAYEAGEVCGNEEALRAIDRLCSKIRARKRVDTEEGSE